MFPSHKPNSMSFEVSTMENTKITAFFDVTLCSLVQRRQTFQRNMVLPSSRQKHNTLKMETAFPQNTGTYLSNLMESHHTPKYSNLLVLWKKSFNVTNSYDMPALHLPSHWGFMHVSVFMTDIYLYHIQHHDLVITNNLFYYTVNPSTVPMNICEQKFSVTEYFNLLLPLIYTANWSKQTVMLC
jgi:hypothetical protein